MRKQVAEELLAVCKEWVRYFETEDDQLILGSDGKPPNDEFRALYTRMSNAIEDADPTFWEQRDEVEQT